MRPMLAVAVLAAMLPATAAAHGSDWFWNVAKAENRLEYSSYGRSLGIRSASCKGRGGSMLGNASGARLYQHFDCYLNTRRGPYYGVLHVLTRDTFLLTIKD